MKNAQKYIGLLLVATLSGCAIPMVPQRQIAVDALTIVVADQRNIRALYRQNYGIDLEYIGGFCDQRARVIFVQWDFYETNHPNFYALGHEVWHLYECGGSFHK